MNASVRPTGVLRIPVMLAVFSVFSLAEAVRCSSLSNLANADMWWHLSTGLWMLQHHSLPHNGLFSQFPDRAWIEPSWAYDLKLALYYKLLGLRAVALFAIGAKATLGVITFLLAGGRRNFWPALVLSLIGQYLLVSFPPAPAFGSLLFLGVEALLLLESRRRRNPGLLWWLPPLFLIWANADIYFVYGLGLMILFLAASVYGSSLERRSQNSPAFDELQSFRKLVLIAGASVLATFVTPYFFQPYGVFFSTVFSPANSVLPNYHAPGFRQPEDYILLLFVMSAFLALGLRRSRDLFLIAFLTIAAGLSFHAQRDIWVVIIAALAVIGEAARPSILSEELASRMEDHAGSNYFQSPAREILIATGLTLVTLILTVAFLVPQPDALLAKAGQTYPVAAANYIREHDLPQPIFNAFEWGGFLTWYLPGYPVAIDGRLDLYGKDYILDYSKMMNAEIRYTDFPAIADARTILLPSAAIMAGALSSVPTFEVAYKDDVAVVLTNKGP